jgi:hypothetical protein
VPLRDITAFYEWIEREDPPISVVVAVKAWIDGLDENPWQAPSEPVEVLSVSGQYQTREAVVFDVDILYQEEFPIDAADRVQQANPTGPVDLIDVRGRGQLEQG